MTRADEKIFQVKSQLAKLLATENISIRHDANMTTAAFDTANRVLFLPVWQNISNDLYDMLVVHEVGHALYTPPTSWMDAIKTIAKRSHGGKGNSIAEGNIKLFLNVVEDARIDKLQKRRYPGSKKNYLAGYKELFDRDFFGIKNKDVNSLMFIDRANVYFKGGLQSLNIQFSPEEKAFISRMEKLETFEEVIELTEELYNYAKKEVPSTVRGSFTLELEEDEDGEYGEIEDGSTESVDEDIDEDTVSKLKVKSKSEKGDKKESQDKNAGSDDSDEEKSDSESENTSSNEGAKDSAGSGEVTEFPTSITEKAAQQQAKTLVGNSNVNFLYLKLPQFDLKKILDDYSVVVPELESGLRKRAEDYGHKYEDYVKDLNEWKTREKDVINYMVKEFEMRKSADMYSRTSIAKTGVIDTNKLHSYKYNDDVFKRLTVVPQGKNHGFVMIVDWSSSMYCQLEATIKQLISLVLFCKKVQIPFEVLLFRSIADADGYSKIRPYVYDHQKQFSDEDGTLRLEGFKLRNVLSSRMNTAMLNRAIHALWVTTKLSSRTDPLSSTPLNQAIVVLPDIVNDFRRKNKCQVVSTVVLTDGSSDPVAGWNFSQKSPARSGGTKVILTDEKTQKTYVLNGDAYSWGYDATKAFLDMLKERTGCKLVGFFMQSSNLSMVPGADYSVTHSQKNMELWKKNNFISVNCAGYDEYFIVDANSMNRNAQNNQLKTTTGMSANRIIKEFMKVSGKKVINRSLINQFITQIAEDRKRA
jgi:hypothetical protein